MKSNLLRLVQPGIRGGFLFSLIGFWLAVAPCWAATETDELLIRLAPGTDAQSFARDHGLTYLHTLRSDPDMHVVKAKSVKDSQTWLKNFKDASKRSGLQAANSALQNAWLNKISRNRPRAFVPNDPYYFENNPQGFPGQWHLNWTAHPELDARLPGAWNRNLTGEGVTIGIVDDGLDTQHPDLSPNYVAKDSWDFYRDEPEPDPVEADENHGTSVSGVAAARGGNGIGVTGAAPYAHLAGLRIHLVSNATTSIFVDATKYHSSGTNRTIRVKNHSYGPDDPFEDNDAEKEAMEESAKAGTIHCVSAGNERGEAKEDANKDAVAGSPHVITVAALANSGVYATYSCFGANVFVTAPSSSERDAEWEITTTDRVGTAGYNNERWPANPYPDLDYTADFGGTSSSAPLVSGIMALGVQANPNLDVRLAKHLLARSCDRVDPNDTSESSDGGWKTNGAGFCFNQNYGFGKINADRFTQLARQYSGVTPLARFEQANPMPADTTVPPETDIIRTFTVTSNAPLETVELGLAFTNIVARDMEAYLTSPQGTQCRLFMRGLTDTNMAISELSWVFASHAFWGENPQGKWTITVRNTGDHPNAYWSFYQFSAQMGQPIPVQPVIQVASLRYLPDNQFQFTFSGIIGCTYHIYSTSNFEDWTWMKDVLLTEPTAVVLDSDAQQSQRFYRIVAP